MKYKIIVRPEAENDLKVGCPKRPQIIPIRFPVFRHRETLLSQDVPAAKARNLGSKNRERFPSRFGRPNLKEAFSWYENRREGLGHDFLLQAEAGLRFIERSPEVCPSEYKGARKHFIKRFPYKIIYLIEGEIIIVLAVIHSKRSPNIIKKRIDNN